MARPTALGCQVFAGGFTLGVREHFEVVDQLETGPFGSETTRRNLGLRVPEDEEDWQPGKYEGVDMVYANPPCAPWSMYGRTKGVQRPYVEHPGYAYHETVHRLIDRVRPKFWVLESVPQIAAPQAGGSKYVDWLSGWAYHRGYATTLLFLDGKHTGLPQRRRRVFLVFHSLAFRPRPPGIPPVTAGEAILPYFNDPGWVHEMPDGWLEIARRVGAGRSLRNAWLTMGNDAPPLTRKLRLGDQVLDPDGPAPTMLGYCPPNFIHPFADRFIGLREFATLCGYPDWYSWPKRPIDALCEMTRAVLPPPAAYLAGEVANALAIGDPLEGDWQVPHFVDYRPKTGSIGDYTQLCATGPWFAQYQPVEEQQGVEYAGVE